MEGKRIFISCMAYRVLIVLFASAYKPRKFVASDSQEYIWSYRTQEGQEWTVCFVVSERGN